MTTIARTSRSTRLLAAAAAGLCAIAAALSGCASGVQQRVNMPPSDAMLSVTVMPQRPRFQRPEREFAPARYVVEADGVLRAAVGEGVTVETYPGRPRPDPRGMGEPVGGRPGHRRPGPGGPADRQRRDVPHARPAPGAPPSGCAAGAAAGMVIDPRATGRPRDSSRCSKNSRGSARPGKPPTRRSRTRRRGTRGTGRVPRPASLAFEARGPAPTSPDPFSPGR